MSGDYLGGSSRVNYIFDERKKMSVSFAGKNNEMNFLSIIKKNLGTTESRTRIVGFKVQSDNHYTIAPMVEGRWGCVDA